MKKITKLILAFSLLFSASSYVLAFDANNPGDIAPFQKQSVVVGGTSDAYKIVENVIYSIVSYMYMAFFGLAVVFILLAAYNFLMGGSDEKRLTTAKNQLKWAVIAIIVALLAGGASLVIKSFVTAAAN